MQNLKSQLSYVFLFSLLTYSVTGSVPPRHCKIETLVNQVALLRRNFTYCSPSLVASNDMKFAFQFARDAVVSQISWCAETSKDKSLKETCVICFEDIEVSKMFSIDRCLHRYCFSCMRQHVEVKLLNGLIAECPHEGCKSEVNIESCGEFLPPELVKVPWHNYMTCYDYKRSNPQACADDQKLESLATKKRWRGCPRVVCAVLAILFVADVRLSFAIPVELNGRTRGPRVAVRSGMSATSYVMFANDENDESMIYCQTERSFIPIISGLLSTSEALKLCFGFRRPLGCPIAYL
ncbi:hypothetical protein FNV43_RR05494 [Rhamnella rubrinervis]|uniref:RING-type domain-containing protein n=1 Tax=Rhamnella rubrinervis TaxID=2594499 RepID=A0A8K0MQH7_9ROSA|nr:hypothetical protein FNV43_RR05494 [Rhamnella rubrinervis]